MEHVSYNYVRKYYNSCRVADPHDFNADPNPAFHFSADPDPTFHLSADPGPDPALLRSDENLRPLVYRSSLASWHPRLDVEPLKLF